jgi:hypothetical protein
MVINSETSLQDLRPEEIVGCYYDALRNGDLESLRVLMTPQSYFMALDSLGLKLAFKDPAFKEMLGKIEEDAAALEQVEEALGKDLPSRNHPSEIEIGECEPNGSERMTVHYTEDGKVKKFYFSKEEDGWKINYYAGRKVD